MESIQSLPQELLLNVFERLSRRDLQECILVCKFWLSVAKQEYFREIVASSRNSTTLSSMLLKKGSASKNLDDDTCWIRELTIKDYKPELYPTLLSYLPNLKKLNFTSILSFSQYIRGSDLIQNSPKHNCIEDISIPITEDGIQSPGILYRYFLLCYDFRATITHLRLDRLNQNYDINEQSGTGIQLLHNFKNLTHLCLYNNPNHQGSPALNMYSLFILIYSASTFTASTIYPIHSQ